eukprot:1159524-Pelagomonas_calceolata.AAC.2
MQPDIFRPNQRCAGAQRVGATRVNHCQQQQQQQQQHLISRRPWARATLGKAGVPSTCKTSRVTQFD